MEILSSEYGWTPSQIRKERTSDMLSYFDILQVKADMIKKNK